MSGRALVTGGAGFIGSHLCEALVAAGYSVRVLDDFSGGDAANLAAVEGSVEVIRGDCRREDDARNAVEGCDVVFHEAALPSVQRSVEDPALSHSINLDATLTMLRAAVAAKVGRFVFAGSSSAYGESEELPKRETLAPEPLSPYAAQKLASEAYCRAFARCFDLHTVVLRYFNVYGPRQDPSSPYSGVISLFVTSLLDGRAPTIYGDGEQTRDFVYVDDVARANLAAATADVPRGSVINVAGGRRVSVNELFRTVRAQVGGAAAGLEPTYAPPRTGDVRHSLADLSRARRGLGWEPEVPLDAGIAETVRQYRKEKKS
ncbi:MAG: NAD-dependent epimerase/dehydratase family protein [Planctomycetota bacterium JB042]